MNDETEVISVVFPKELKKKLRFIAVEEDMSLTELCCKILSEFIEKRTNGRNKRKNS